jgi:hypothetical protein
MNQFQILAYALLCLAIGRAQASSAEWKLYGGASDKSGHVICFFDADGVVKAADGHIQVWTKCLLQSELEHVDIENEYDGQILEATARKMAKHYVPPIGALEDMDADKATGVTLYEEVANIANIQPRARILYEFNCKEQMLRELRLYVQSDRLAREKPKGWTNVPPEGNAARLVKLLCPLN